MKVGDLVRWKKTGKIAIYLGSYNDNDDGSVYRFHNDEYGIIEQWSGALEYPVEQLVEVVSAGR